MFAYVARRLALAVVTVFAAVLISFLLVHATDGSPGAIRPAPAAPPPRSPQTTTSWAGTCRSGQQFFDYLGHLVRGDLGTSLIDSQDIGADLADPAAGHRLHRPLRHAAVRRRRASSLGVTAAVRGGRFGRFITSSSGVALSLPAFWVGILLVYVLSLQLGWLPATGYVRFTDDPVGWLQSLLLPGAHADRRRRGDHRPHRLRRDARGAAAGAHPHPAGRGHAGLADPLRARAALRQRPGGLGARHPVHRPVRRLGDHREPLRAARSRPGQPGRLSAPTTSPR